MCYAVTEPLLRPCCPAQPPTAPCLQPTHTQGTTTVTVTATDSAGNIATATITVTIRDGTPPTITQKFDEGKDKEAFERATGGKVSNKEKEYDVYRLGTTATGAMVSFHKHKVRARGEGSASRVCGGGLQVSTLASFACL